MINLKNSNELKNLFLSSEIKYLKNNILLEVKKFKLQGGIVFMTENNLFIMVKKILSNINRKRFLNLNNSELINKIKQTIDLYNIAFCNLKIYNCKGINFVMLENFAFRLLSLLPLNETLQLSFFQLP